MINNVEVKNETCLKLNRRHGAYNNVIHSGKCSKYAKFTQTLLK
jgi:hypothetical protein